MHLQSRLSETENKIAYSRQFYNDKCSCIIRQLKISSQYFAGMFGYKENILETQGEERRPVKVQFNCFVNFGTISFREKLKKI